MLSDEKDIEVLEGALLIAKHAYPLLVGVTIIKLSFPSERLVSFLGCIKDLWG
jgi:hypothetical protein